MLRIQEKIIGFHVEILTCPPLQSRIISFRKEKSREISVYLQMATIVGARERTCTKKTI